MKYLGDITPGKTIRCSFNTRDAAGAPITLAGTPAVSVYKDAGTTESTAGVTLTVDFDSRTGLHLVAVDTSADGTFYSAGSDFQLVITSGTVDGVSVVGVVVGFFSIANRSPLRPTVADRTLDVSADGEAGVDWANVGGQGSTVNLTATSILTATNVETDTQDIQGRLPAALVSGRMSSDAVAISGSTAAADAVEANIGNLDAAVSTRASQSSVNTIGTNVDAILADTGTDGVVVAAGSKTGYSLAAAGLDAITIETGLNARQALSIIASSSAGVLAGAATANVTIAAAGVPATNRISAVVDADGNRSSVTLSPPA